jgi:hypothetical protein
MLAMRCNDRFQRHCKRKQTNPESGKEGLDCFVANALAMTEIVFIP